MLARLTGKIQNGPLVATLSIIEIHSSCRALSPCVPMHMSLEQCKPCILDFTRIKHNCVCVCVSELNSLWEQSMYLFICKALVPAHHIVANCGFYVSFGSKEGPNPDMRYHVLYMRFSLGHFSPTYVHGPRNRLQVRSNTPSEQVHTVTDRPTERPNERTTDRPTDRSSLAST